MSFNDASFVENGVTRDLRVRGRMGYGGVGCVDEGDGESVNVRIVRMLRILEWRLTNVGDGEGEGGSRIVEVGDEEMRRRSGEVEVEEGGEEGVEEGTSRIGRPWGVVTIMVPVERVKVKTEFFVAKSVAR